MRTRGFRGGFLRLPMRWGKGKGMYCSDMHERLRTIRAVIRGQNIARYFTQTSSGLRWVIFDFVSDASMRYKPKLSSRFWNQAHQKMTASLTEWVLA